MSAAVSLSCEFFNPLICCTGDIIAKALPSGKQSNLGQGIGKKMQWSRKVVSVRPETAVKLMAVSGKMGKLTRPAI